MHFFVEIYSSVRLTLVPGNICHSCSRVSDSGKVIKCGDRRQETELTASRATVAAIQNKNLTNQLQTEAFFKFNKIRPRLSQV